MKIHGLQKMTLLDFPGRVACTVFLGGCDFNCPFCHNSELIDGTATPMMDDKEFLAFLSKRKGLLDGVAITGGEPLLRKDIVPFLESIKELGFPVKLDSNGNHPDLLKEIVTNNLVEYIAMDVKNKPSMYATTCGLPSMDLSAVKESIEFLKSCSINYEFRTTVVDELHDESSFEEMGPWISGAKQYFLQAFTDRDTVVFSGFHAPSNEKMLKYKEIMEKYVSHVEIRGVDI